MDPAQVQPAARWTSDCGGKQDYDGPLLSISTRYWPAWKSADNRPSAHASIIVKHGLVTEDDEWGDYSTLAEVDVQADAEAEVKAQVEAWVRTECARILTRLGVASLPGDGGATG
jgi:hypothetical protein